MMDCSLANIIRAHRERLRFLKTLARIPADQFVVAPKAQAPHQTEAAILYIERFLIYRSTNLVLSRNDSGSQVRHLCGPPRGSQNSFRVTHQRDQHSHHHPLTPSLDPAPGNHQPDVCLCASPCSEPFI